MCFVILRYCAIAHPFRPLMPSSMSIVHVSSLTKNGCFTLVICMLIYSEHIQFKSNRQLWRCQQRCVFVRYGADVTLGRMRLDLFQQHENECSLVICHFISSSIYIYKIKTYYMEFYILLSPRYPPSRYHYFHDLQARQRKVILIVLLQLHQEGLMIFVVRIQELPPRFYGSSVFLA